MLSFNSILYKQIPIVPRAVRFARLSDPDQSGFGEALGIGVLYLCPRLKSGVPQNASYSNADEAQNPRIMDTSNKGIPMAAINTLIAFR